MNINLTRTIGIPLIISYCSLLLSGCLTTHKTKYPLAIDSSSLSFIKLGKFIDLSNKLSCCNSSNANDAVTQIVLGKYTQPALTYQNELVPGVDIPDGTTYTIECKTLNTSNDGGNDSLSSVVTTPANLYLDKNHKSFATLKVTIKCEYSSDSLSGQWPKNPDDTNFPSSDYYLFSSNLLFGDIIQLKANHAKQPNKK